MATYIPGLTDYIPQIQPFQPDYNFFGNILQTRQTRYDAAKKQVSDLYGSLLNSPMLKDENIQRRENFFKVINEDIQKISGMDLSLKQNEDAALGVFKGFYDDKYMVNDMVKTKKLYNQIERGKAFKNCTDPEKCGGQYWEPGMQKLYYKMEEFKKMSNDEALDFDMGEYDPYFDWEKDAIKVAKESGLSVTRDRSNGKFIVRDKNGDLLQGGLYKLFTDVYGNDPRVAANYQTKAYVHRKDTVKQTAAQYGSEEEAERMYVQSAMQASIKAATKNYKDFSDAYDQANARKLQLEKQQKTKGLTTSDKKYYDSLVAELPTLLQTKEALDLKVKNLTSQVEKSDMATLISKVDSGVADYFLDGDLKKTAEALSHRDEEHLYQDTDPAYDHKLALDLKKYDHDLSVIRDVIQSNLRIQEEEAKAGIKGVTGTKGKTTVTPTTLTQAGALPVQGSPGSVAVDEEMNKHPELYYMTKAKEAGDSLLSAGKEDAHTVLWQTFQAAKGAKQENGALTPGAKQYLDQMYGDKWKDVTTPTQLANLIKTSPAVYMQKSINYLSEKKNDISWGEDVIIKNRKLIESSRMESAAARAEVNKLQSNVSNAVQTMVDSKNPMYRYAKHLVNSNGFINLDEKPTAAYMKAYMKEHPNADISDMMDDYHESKKELFRLVKESGSETLTLGSTKVIPKVDANNPNDVVNNEILKIVDQSSTQPGSFVIRAGNASKGSYEGKEDQSINAFANDFLSKIRKVNEDEKAPLYKAYIQNVSADSKDLSSFTIVPAKKDIDDYFGNTKEVTESGIKDKVAQGFTYFFDNNLIKTDLTGALGVSKIEKILTNSKDHMYNITTYKETAGTVNVKYDPNTKKTTIKPTYVVYTGSGKEEIPGKQTVIDDIKLVQGSVDEILAGFENLQTKNLSVDEATALTNKFKSEQ